jgi:hypothetical protein
MKERMASINHLLRSLNLPSRSSRFATRIILADTTSIFFPTGILIEGSGMFEKLPYCDDIIYRALVIMVKSNNGYGFNNNNQDHIAYRVGRDGTVDHDAWGDSPDDNTLYKMMVELSEELLEHPDFPRSVRVHNWSDFCCMATDAYDAHQ